MSFWKTLGKIAAIAAPIAAAPFTGGASLALIGAGAGAAGGALSGGGVKGALLGAGLGAIPGIGGAGSAAKGAASVTGSSAGNILKTIGKAVAANPEVIGGIASTAAGAAKGQAQQRIVEGGQTLDYAQLAQQAARDKYGSDLAGANAKFGADLAGSNAQFGAGMQGAQFSREGQDRQRKSAILSQLLNNTQDFKATPGNPAIAKAMGTSTGGARPSNLTTNRDALMAQLAQPEIAAPEYSGPAPFAAPTPYDAPGLPTAPKAGVLENVLGGVGLGGSFLDALGKIKGQGQRVPGDDIAGQNGGVPSMPWTLVPEGQNAGYVNPDLFKGVRF